jgi:hypothetical protein
MPGKNSEISPTSAADLTWFSPRRRATRFAQRRRLTAPSRCPRRHHFGW